MGSNVSLEMTPRSEHRNITQRASFPGVRIAPYPSMFRLHVSSSTFLPSLGRPDNPLSTFNFNNLLDRCPLPPDIFRPFPPVDQAAGTIVKTFTCRPPGLCYEKGMRKIDPQRLFYRIDCTFFPNDESRLFLIAGMYVHRPAMSLQRINHLFDGLASEWTFSEPHDCCYVVKGSRSPDTPGLAISSNGRLLAWPSPCGFLLFDRYSGAVTTNRMSANAGDCVKTVAFSPSGRYMATVSSFHRQFVLTFLHNIRSHMPLAPMHHVNLTGIDPTLSMSHTYRECVALRWSSDDNVLAVGSSMGHLLIVFRQRGTVPVILAPTLQLTVAAQETRLASVHAFDFSPIARNELDQRYLLAFASTNARIILFDFVAMTIVNSRQLFLVTEESSRVRCLRFSNSGMVIALGMSDGHVTLIDSTTLETVSELSYCQRLPRPDADNEFLGVSCLSFSCTDRYLAVGLSTGYVHVWCLNRMVLRLADLTKAVIRSRCQFKNIDRLPIPYVIRAFLLDEMKPMMPS